MIDFTEKRKDHLLRNSINSLQSLLVNNSELKDLYDRTLSSALTLSGSSYGFILALNHTEMGVQFDLRAAVSCDTKQAIEHCYSEADAITSPSVNEYWQAYLKHPVPLLLNCSPCTEFLSLVPARHPDVKNSLVLPVVNRKKVSALLFLMNRNGDYEQSIVKRLELLLTTFLCVHRVSESVTVKSPALQAAIPSNTYHNSHLINLINATLNGVVTVDEKYNVITFNSAAENIFGIKARQVMGKSFDRLINHSSGITPTSLRPKNSEDSSASHAVPKIWRGIVGKRECGEVFLMDLSSFQSQFGKHLHTTFVIDDISDRINSAKESREALQRFKALTNLAPVGIIQVNNDWSCSYVNDTWCKFSGLSSDEAAGQAWMNAIHHQDVAVVLDELRFAIKNSIPFEKSFRLQTPLGHITWVKANARSLYDEQGRERGFLGTFSDITDHRATEKKLREIAEFDQLTGLVNRSFFKDRLQSALESSYRHGQVNLLFIDLDGFKTVNDTLGHGIGDKLLQQCAERVLNTVRTEDTVARIGGDEFTVILTHIHDDNIAAKIAENIIQSVRAPYTIDSHEIYITTSIGVAVSSIDNVDPDMLIKQADIALYRAKAEGKNKFQFFTPELDAEVKARMFLSNNLHRALERNELIPYYQPQINIETGKIIGFEALLRWHHPEAGELLPDQFVPLLEEIGLIEEVGLWVIRTACQQLADWLSAELKNEGLVTMSVNLSARQLRDPNLPNYIRDILSETGLEPKHLVIEITETVLMDNTDENQKMLGCLREMGIAISLDDFGTGYSSLAYLKRFPINHLKIDRSFVRDILKDADDEAIIRAIIAMAQSLKLEVIAEGVEDGAILDRLKSYGCQRYQGFHFSKAKPADQIISQFYPRQAAVASDLISTPA